MMHRSTRARRLSRSPMQSTYATQPAKTSAPNPAEAAAPLSLSLFAIDFSRSRVALRKNVRARGRTRACTGNKKAPGFYIDARREFTCAHFDGGGGARARAIKISPGAGGALTNRRARLYSPLSA